MPIYEYRCRKNGHEITATRPMANCGDPVECPQCGDWADRIMSTVNFVNSRKQWQGRKQVNFKTDNRDEIAKKQVALMVNSGKVEKYFDRAKMSPFLRKRHMNAMGSMMKNAPAIKVEQ